MDMELLLKIKKLLLPTAPLTNFIMVLFQKVCVFAINVMSVFVSDLIIFFLGTVAENNRDKARKNRAARQPGELHGRHKLTQQQINEIRKTYKPGMIQRRMAEKYKVSYAQICRILNHTRWNSP
jgi:hypothetical protein